MVDSSYGLSYGGWHKLLNILRRYAIWYILHHLDVRTKKMMIFCLKIMKSNAINKKWKLKKRYYIS